MVAPKTSASLEKWSGRVLNFLGGTLLTKNPIFFGVGMTLQAGGTALTLFGEGKPYHAEHVVSTLSQNAVYGVLGYGAGRLFRNRMFGKSAVRKAESALGTNAQVREPLLRRDSLRAKHVSFNEDVSEARFQDTTNVTKGKSRRLTTSKTTSKPTSKTTSKGSKIQARSFGGGRGRFLSPQTSSLGKMNAGSTSSGSRTGSFFSSSSSSTGLTKHNGSQTYLESYERRQQMLQSARTGIHPDHLSAPVHDFYKFIYRDEVSGVESKELVVRSQQPVYSAKGGKGSLVNNDLSMEWIYNNYLKNGTVKNIHGQPLLSTENFMEAVRTQQISRAEFNAVNSAVYGETCQVTSGGVSFHTIQIYKAMQHGDLLPTDIQFLRQLAGHSMTVLELVPSEMLGLV
jgi:hypothetical protein